MTLNVRKPTGAVPWPLVLLEGAEKVGKSYLCALLSASDRVGQTYWLDLGEGAGDEYGAVPGARYLLLPHDGTWPAIFGQVEAARDEARRASDAGELPVVLVIDSMTAEWELLKDWAAGRAKGSNSNKAKLAKDPNADVSIPMNLWNDANSRHRKLMTLLMTFPGIVVMNARGKEVASLDAAGRPVEGTKEYKVEGQKTLAYDASCWVRMFRDEPAMVVGVRSVHTGIRPGKDDPQRLPADWSLEWLVFEALKCDPRKAHVRDLVEVKSEETPEEVRDWALNTAVTVEELRSKWQQVSQDGRALLELTNENGDMEPLGGLLVRLGKERSPKPVAGKANGNHLQGVAA